MNPGDKVEILRGIYKGAIGELQEYYKPTSHSTQLAVVVWQNVRIAIDPWDIALAEDEVSEPNETDTTATGDLRIANS